jgi:enoyl-CoA hydratase/carnithine racemase
MEPGTMNMKYVAVEESDGIGWLTLRRPDAANRITTAVYAELVDAFRALGASTASEVIVIQGDGADFSAGEDFGELATIQEAGGLEQWLETFPGFVPLVWHNPKICIAAVRGRALGIGCELALLADVTLADESALFGHPETKDGFAPRTIWPWLVGPKVAKEYLATGRLMSSQDAKAAGLINTVYPPEKLDVEVRNLAAEIAAMPKGTPSANKKRISWAWRDISRVLYDDRFYDVSSDWLVGARDVDAKFYENVATLGFHEALRLRESQFIHENEAAV